MIGISKLYLGTVESSDALRYGRHSKTLPSHLLQFSKDKKPVVVWNCTQRCNLKCMHCYSSSSKVHGTAELTTEEGKVLLDSLADFGCPVVLFSGGEPLLRRDLPDLASYAVSRGLRAVISTNGLLIDDTMAQRLKDIGLSYVGISLDGVGEVHDGFRGMPGAFEAALAGIRFCKRAGLKVGLRFTVFRGNVQQVPLIFDLLEREEIPRLCIYHLAYTGRGTDISNEDLSHDECRELVDMIIDRTQDLSSRGHQKEVLTVDNHADGPYLYLRMKRESNSRAEDVYRLLKMNGGNSSGNGIGCVSWDGTVYPDQFWRSKPLGNIRDRSFGDIWTDDDNELLMQLKDKCCHVTGRCKQCRFLDVCGGNLRVRAESITGNVWGVDPACYLTAEEIAPA